MRRIHIACTVRGYAIETLPLIPCHHRLPQSLDQHGLQHQPVPRCSRHLIFLVFWTCSAYSAYWCAGDEERTMSIEMPKWVPRVTSIKSPAQTITELSVIGHEQNARGHSYSSGKVGAGFPSLYLLPESACNNSAIAVSEHTCHRTVLSSHATMVFECKKHEGLPAEKAKLSRGFVHVTYRQSRTRCSLQEERGGTGQAKQTRACQGLTRAAPRWDSSLQQANRTSLLMPLRSRDG